MFEIKSILKKGLICFSVVISAISTVGAMRKPNKNLKIQDLTNQEISAVCDYKGPKYIKINQYLRTPEDQRYKDNALDSVIDLISKSINKKKLSCEKTLYRGIRDIDCLVAMLPDYQPDYEVLSDPYNLLDQVIVERAFMSASKSFEVARDFARGGAVFIINSSDKDSKMDFEDVDFKRIKIKDCDIPLEEKEVLFDKGQMMRVNNVYKGREAGDPQYIIEVNIINEE